MMFDRGHDICTIRFLISQSVKQSQQCCHRPNLCNFPLKIARTWGRLALGGVLWLTPESCYATAFATAFRKSATQVQIW